MLPPGIAADALPPAELTRFRTLLPAAQTAAHLRVGPCSCDLVRSRHLDTRELERHRRGLAPAEPRGGWRAALAGFVAEHARNAGPTFYQLDFQPGGRDAGDGQPLTCTVAEVRADPDGWLQEGHPVVVVR
jgi:hypothetical protein